MYRDPNVIGDGFQTALSGDLGAGNQCTKNKVTLFDELLNRFEARLAKAEAAKAKLAGKAVRKAPVKQVFLQLARRRQLLVRRLP